MQYTAEIRVETPHRTWNYWHSISGAVDSLTFITAFSKTEVTRYTGFHLRYRGTRYYAISFSTRPF